MKSITLFLAAALLPLLIQPAGADWPQHLGPGRNGISSETELANAWPENGPEVIWTQPLGEGFAGPAIKNGKVYVLDRIDSKQDVLRCLDLNSGRELWRYTNDDPGKTDFNGSRMAPTLDDENVYCVGAQGTVYCISQSTHKEVWKRNLRTDFGMETPTWGFPRSPVLYKDLVITSPQSAAAGMVAYYKETGDIIWKTPRLCRRPGNSSAVLTAIDGVDQLILVTPKEREDDEDDEEEDEEDEDEDEEEEGPPFEGGGVYGIDANNGSILWNHPGFMCPNPITFPTVIGDGRIFVTGSLGAGSAMLKVTRSGDQFSVEELFTTEVASQIHPAMLYNGHLYMNSNINELRTGLVCMTLSGEVLWKTGRNPSFGRGGFLVADGKIYIIEGDKGDLFMARATPDSYTELGRARLLSGKEMWAPPALSDGMLLIRDQSQMKCVKLN